MLFEDIAERYSIDQVRKSMLRILRNKTLDSCANELVDLDPYSNPIGAYADDFEVRCAFGPPLCVESERIYYSMMTPNHGYIEPVKTATGSNSESRIIHVDHKPGKYFRQGFIVTYDGIPIGIAKVKGEGVFLCARSVVDENGMPILLAGGLYKVDKSELPYKAPDNKWSKIENPFSQYEFDRFFEETHMDDLSGPAETYNLETLLSREGLYERRDSYTYKYGVGDVSNVEVDAAYTINDSTNHGLLDDFTDEPFWNNDFAEDQR